MSPRNDEIMAVLTTSFASADQLCDRMRDLFGPSLADLQEEIYEVNKANGWFDEDRDFAADIALLHSEVSEMFEAYRDWKLEDMTEQMCVHTSGHDEHICKPQGVGSEAADILVRLLDSCKRHNIDLLAETQRKVTFNATRGYKHGGKVI